MKIIWYLLKCPEGKEADCVEQCRRLTEPEGIGEIICFQYQRMLRYGGSWHLENRTALPGYIFLSDSKTAGRKEKAGEEAAAAEGRRHSSRKAWAGCKDSKAAPPSMIPCHISCLKELCSEGNLIGMSQGIIKNGIPIVTQGPLKGREHLIRKIDRHKRTAEIEIRLAGRRERMAVGLEIYEKQQ